MKVRDNAPARSRAVITLTQILCFFLLLLLDLFRIDSRDSKSRRIRLSARVHKQQRLEGAEEVHDTHFVPEQTRESCCGPDGLTRRLRGKKGTFIDIFRLIYSELKLALNG